MRQLGEFEKRVVSDIASERSEYHEYRGEKYLSNSIGRIMFDQLGIVHMCPLTEHEEGQTIKIVYDNQINSGFKIAQIFDLVFLLKYLEANALVGISTMNSVDGFTIPGYVQGDFGEFGVKEMRDLGEPYGIRNVFSSYRIEEYSMNTSLADDILRYGSSLYYPSQELKELVANEFKSREQIYVEKQLSAAEKQLSEAKKQTCYALATMIVAVITLLMSVLLPVVMK